jgi:hypothetical protein
MRENKDLLLAEIRDALRLASAHYGLWFAEAVHQLGVEAAVACEAEAGGRALDIAVSRLGKAVGFETENGLPKVLADMDEQSLRELAGAMAVNWLAVDGVWFQAVEGLADMNDAKRVNDTCWKRFSPLEAALVMRRLDISAGGGLDALEPALSGRLYARINEQTLRREEGALVLSMVKCRVQAARERKGLEPYPCKSGGSVEYASFARAVDPRIRVECLACPPDELPEGLHCSWRFSLPEAGPA